jgi:DNA-binding response OmpR family regulator
MLHMLSDDYSDTVQVFPHFRMGLSSASEAGVRAGSWGRPAAKAVQTKGVRKRTALIVEDNPTLRRIMSEHVARMDFDVLTAAHYAAALVHLAACTPDIACVDIGLPSESGYELCEYIRGPLGLMSLPIMVTSEFGSPENMAYAEEAGADAFLEKPFSMPDLGANIEALLRGVWPRAVHAVQSAARRRNGAIDNYAALDA